MKQLRENPTQQVILKHRQGTTCHPGTVVSTEEKRREMAKNQRC